MSEMHETDSSVETPSEPVRKRPRPGERRLQILQTLASMLEQPGAERVTTASLATRIGVSEAALYRHFASKAQMFEGLLDFVEQSVMNLIRQVTDREAPGPQQAARIVALLLQFAEKNPGMCKVMTGDALVLEHERLQERVNLLFDKIEAGEALFTIDQQQYMQGYLPVVFLYLNITNQNTVGGGLPVMTGPGFVTKDNVAAVRTLVEAGTR